MEKEIPVKVAHLFPVLDQLLIELLRSLTIEEWNKPTIAKLWSVKDIAAHLLDTNFRTISVSRDKHFGPAPEGINSYADLVSYLNKLNMDWTAAFKRVSPQLLIELLESSGKQFCQVIQSLAPFDKAVYSVAWAGQDESYNWFHIAREYTEKFIHQQQIRDAVGKQALFTKELFFPFIDTFMYGLPYTFRDISAAEGTIVSVKVTTEIGGEWHLEKTAKNWELKQRDNNKKADAIVTIDPGTAWKLFSKGIKPAEARQSLIIEGDETLGTVVLNMVSVMA